MGLFEVLNRHRNKILLAGGAAGAVLVVNKILSSYEKQWNSSSSRGFVHEARKKEIHFENIINECNQLCYRMSPKIIKRLQEVMDDSKLIEQLASKRNENVQSKVEIWKQLKVKILTKLLSEVYCTCILVCCMRVQMSVIGGQVFAQSINKDTSGASSSASVADLTHVKAYTKYYALISTYYDRIFDRLIEPIQEAVDETLRSYSLDYKISLKDFREILEKIEGSLSLYLSGSFLEVEKLATVELNSAICSDTSGQLSENDEKVLRNMLDETQDILESSDYKKVLKSSIEVGYSVLLDFLLQAFLQIEEKLDHDKKTFSNPNAIQVPMAKILPQIRQNYLKRTELEQKALVNHLLGLDVLNCFAANIYEAFCMTQ